MFGSGRSDLELIYVVNGADWKPLYDLRLTEEASQPALGIELSGRNISDKRRGLGNRIPIALHCPTCFDKHITRA